jgi:hypothetical protein
MDAKRFPELIRAIYQAVDSLETMFPGRHFTPDGHMVGSIGEALAAFHYGITLLPASNTGHDGTIGGRRVEIKATQGSRIALSSEPEHLLVLKLGRDGSFTEVYNGPGFPVWSLVNGKSFPKNGQHQIAISALRRLMVTVADGDRLVRRAFP